MRLLTKNSTKRLLISRREWLSLGLRNGWTREASESYYRFVHRDGRGLMNNGSLDRMRLSDDEEEELIDLFDFGLRQPPRGLDHRSVFAFTQEGIEEHARLIELLTKASTSGVVQLSLPADEWDVVWRSDDGQVALIPRVS